MESVTEEADRISRSSTRRTATGYLVENRVGDGAVEAIEITGDHAAQVDAETFLGPRIRAGEAKPGATFKLPVLHAGRRAVVDADLEVVGPDEEGPGLKVRESFEGNVSLWWFADDGSVQRIRSGNAVTRRDDAIRLDDLRGAAYSITLSSDHDLPRLFTTKTMIVDVVVRHDETTRPPQIPPNPFTEVVEMKEDRARLRLTSHDDAAATLSLPIPPEGHEEYLKATPFMEVDSAVLKAAARRIVGAEKDARKAAVLLADHVFQHLRKQSPEIAQPTALWIHRNGMGDCSEHALYFTALCRAAGIPARRCSGYVNIGSDWGAHAWCEVWLGKWIGADPTTNEIGTRARYIFLSHPDDPGERVATITAERTRIYIRRAEYDDGVLDFEKGEIDAVVHSGVRTAELKDGWTASHELGGARIAGPGVGIRASIRPDHGYWRHITPEQAARMGGEVEIVTLGGKPAMRRGTGGRQIVLVSLGREILQIDVRCTGDREFTIEELAALLEPTLARDA
jgi:transglutaminase-like putative cysteine protease